MKYIFDTDLEKPIEERILQINNASNQVLDVSNFNVDYNQEILINFKEKLLENKDKKFLIVGDYDCDGICATAIIKKLFDDLKISNNYYIPSRIKEGYGLNNDIVNNAYNNKFECIICVDNGVVATSQIALAYDLGLKVFIIDHHEYQDRPMCEALLHPNLFSIEYSDMCASGICTLLSNSFRQDDLTIALGGIATLADMVSILSYNRYLVKQMFSIVSNGNIRPINLLLGNDETTYTNIQFNVIPKINAVSRLDGLMNVNYVVRFLLSDDENSFSYAQKIETINNARKEYSKQMFELAQKIVDINKNIIVIKHEDFKEGLCGLVANRLLESCKKPVIVLAQDGGLLKGSGRSVEGVDLYNYLKDAKDLFEAFGGHELAVGLSMKLDNFDKFIDYVDKHKISYEEKTTDVILINQEELNNDLLNRIDSLEPYGTNFKKPLLGIEDVKYNNKVIVSNKYPKYIVSDSLSAICFKTSLKDVKFKYMIGNLQKDSYYRDRLSFIIEDLA